LFSEKFGTDGEQKERENCNVMSALPKPRKQPEIAFFLFARPIRTHRLMKWIKRALFAKDTGV
jgi:hypothetical protein